MKKTLAIVMALAMALGMIASFAFVVAPTTTSRTNAPIGIDMWATDAMATTQGTRIWTDFVDKSEDLYAKNSLIYFVMQIRAYNSVQNADVAPAVGQQLMDVALTSTTVDLSLIEMTGAVVTAPTAFTTPIFGSASKIVTGVAAPKLLQKKANIQNRYDFKIAYASNTGANGYDLNTPGVLAINIQEGKATDGVAAYTDYYVGFAGLTRNEITAKGSVVANVGYNGASEKFADNGTLKVVKGDRTYMIKKVNADNWAIKTTSYYDYTTGAYVSATTQGYAVFVKVGPTSYNYVGQLDTEVTTVEGYGQSLGISVDKAFLANNTSTGFIQEATIPSYAPDATANLTKVLPYTFLTTKYVLAEDAPDGSAVAGSDAFTAAQLATFETFMSDFGFSAANTYKLQDKDFTVAGSYQATITAEYNGGQVVPIEPEDDDSEIVDEPTDEEPEIEEDPDVEEEPDVDEEPEVPAETGDFSSDVAIVLAVSALAAAAALAFVMKKVRD